MKPEDKMTEADLAIVKEHLQKLSEHFDAVHIFASRHEPGVCDGTINIEVGAGNWFARYGQVSAWVEERRERMRIEQRNEQCSE